MAVVSVNNVSIFYITGDVKSIGVKEFVISYVGNVIGSHTGPGVIALYFFGVPREEWQG